MFSHKRILSALTVSVLLMLTPHDAFAAGNGNMNNRPKQGQLVSGILNDVFPDDVDNGFLFLTLLDSSNKTEFVACPSPDAKASAQSLRHLIGRIISIRATITSTNHRWNRRLLNSTLEIKGTNDIEVISSPVLDPFDIPSLTDNPPSLNEMATCGPRKAVGTVVARWNGNSFLLRLSDGDAIKVQLRNDDLPDLYQPVTVVGVINTDLYRHNFSQAQWRSSGTPAPGDIPPESVTFSWLFKRKSSFAHIINSTAHGMVIRIRGHLSRVLTDEAGRRRLLVTDGPYSLLANCSDLPESATALREGCELEVTGVCVMDSENWQGGMSFPKVQGLFLVLRTPGDIRILKQPPWLTPGVCAVIILGLLAALTVILIWNATLRALVARKSRALLREQAEKLSETLKIDERTRLAAELHDYLAQNLSVISCQIAAAKSAFRLASDEIGPLLDTTDKMVQSCCTDLRRCLWDLKNDALNEPDLDKAIVRTAAPVAGNVKLVTRFPVRRSLLTDSTAHTILSIIRELVSNAVWHGHAKSIHIAGELRDGAIRFSVRDDGAGFDPSSRPGQAEGHFGLDGVKERIKHMNGRLDIDSTPGKGTRVVVTLKARSAK